MISYLRKKLDGQSKELFKNSSWVFVANMIGMAMALLRSIVIGRFMAVEVLGIYTVVIAFVGVVQEMLNLNIGTPIIKYGAEYHARGETNKLQAIIRYSVRVSGIMSIVSVALIFLLITISYDVFIDKPNLTWFIVAYAFANSLTYLNTISKSVLRLYYKFKLNSIITIIADVLEFAIVAAISVIYPKNLNMFFVAVLITRFLNCIITNYMAYTEVKPYFKNVVTGGYELIKADMKKFWNFAIGNSLGNTVRTFISQGDVLLLKAVAGPAGTAYVAFYNVAKKLGYSILALTDPLVNALFPQTSKLIAEKRYAEIKNMIWKMAKLSAIPSLVFLVVTFFLKDFIITSLYGKAFAPASLPFFWFVLGAVIGSIFFWTLPLMQSLDLIKYRLGIYIICIIVSGTLGFILIPMWQATGMAIALLATTVIVSFSFAWLSFREIDKLQFKNIVQTQ